MSLKIKNTIIFAGIAMVFVLIYIFFVRKDQPELETNLVSSSNPVSSPGSTVQSTTTLDQRPSIAKDFLSLLLNVKNIKLDDAIFSDIAFNNLRDSSITLVPDGNEGRPNPFAPLGTDNIEIPQMR